MTTATRGQWRLEHLEVVNWGTFHGHHTVDVARKGFLLTGHSGSGKSSLVDAITAVLTPRGKTRFNAAAADATTRADDRTVLSYVRGAWRRAADGDSGEIATQYLRPGATWSGIALRYADGTQRDGAPRELTLVKLFHVKRGANTPGDVQDLHLLLNGRIGLLELEEHARNGLDVRGIKKAWPAADVQAEHRRFAAKFSRALGISGDRAILLLHKTQSAKNLGSLDELFRTFMLDEPTTFATADRAVEQFTDLSQAHDAVVQARQQIEHLSPLANLSQQFDDAGAAADGAAELACALDDFTQAWKLELTRHARESAAEDTERAEEAEQAARTTTEQADLRVRQAQAAVDERGGARLEILDVRAQAAEEALTATRSERDRVERDLNAVQIAMPASFDELIELRRTAAALVASAEDDARHAEASARALHRERADVAKRHQEADEELRALRSGRSNVDRALVNARKVIAAATGLPASALPFVAELLQVRPEFAGWTGAIERVLRPFARVLLVPAAHEVAVSAAVDAAHLGAHLRYEVVPTAVGAPRQPSSEKSLVYRVDVAGHSMAAWVNAELARRFDYLCVETASELTAAERAVTRAGQVKRGRRSYEKDDRFAVDDRSRWVLGFDNADKIDLFLDRLRAATRELEAIDARLGAAERERQANQKRIGVLESLAAVEWAAIDVTAREDALEAQRRARAELLAADGDLRQGQYLLAAAQDELVARRQAERTAADAAANARAALAQLTATIRELEAVEIGEVAPSLAARLEAEFYQVRASRHVTHQSIDSDSRKVAQGLSSREREALASRSAAQLAIVGVITEFLRRWPALASDLTDSIEDRGGFLGILGTLRADRLPDFEQRFFDLLREQSQQNVGLLAEEIRRAPKEIRRRVDPINSSLRRSQFAPGRYLKIQVDEARPAVAAEFLRDLGTIATGSLAAEEDRQEAEARFAVLARVMRRLGSSEAADRVWRNQCLDTRRHVRFVAHEVDADGEVLDVYDSGEGRSGGQKQKLVVFCLAAALRYQLARGSDDVPSYGSVVMDEAFDKADATFTRMALDIFREFGFHMILATPLKLLQTLEDYVGGIALVTCADSRDSHLAPVPFDVDGAAPGANDPDTVGTEDMPQVLELELGLS
ncbi:ATP-binding protein [Georgenia yuyongxinii]|uniref:AAA family ATPase n=1 Tax=Georgenia yuyongxinii TaxID=2589797 RepID=A0A552WSL7_9MICO|nr:ATP-binding protein [Georgenia yuyongxinii]TRW45734.1 AAA family ATPase [Georgenia yuyongxinii]